MRQTRLQWGAVNKAALSPLAANVRGAAAVRDVITIEDEETEVSDERVQVELSPPAKGADVIAAAAPSALDVNMFASFAFKGDVSRGFGAASLPSVVSSGLDTAERKRKRTAVAVPATQKAARQTAATKKKPRVAEADVTDSLASLPSTSSAVSTDVDAASIADLESVASTHTASSTSSGSRGRHRCLPPLLPQPSLGHPPPRLLVLGSAPSEASLKAQNYYAFKYNHFWPIMSSLFHFSPVLPYPERVLALTGRAVAVWDVCREFSRQGSLDSNLRAILPNDILSLLHTHPSIRLIANNGGTSSKLFHKHCDTADLKRRGIRIVQLPSSSPAHAMKNPVEEKTKRWKALLNVDDEGNFLNP